MEANEQATQWLIINMHLREKVDLIIDNLTGILDKSRLVEDKNPVGNSLEKNQNYPSKTDYELDY